MVAPAERRRARFLDRLAITSRPGARLSLLAVGLTLAVGCNCGRHAPAARSVPTHHAAPAPPDGLVWDGSVGGGATLLSDLSTRLTGTHLQALIPRSPAALLSRFATLPPGVADRIPDDAAVWALGMRRGGGDRIYFAAAVRVRVDRGRHPLGPAVQLVPGAPQGALWVGAQSEPGKPAVALAGNVLVVGQDPETLGDALPWLAWGLVRRKAERGFAVRVVDGVVSGKARALADAALTSRTDAALASARAERTHHSEPPTLGDPEALITLVHDRLAHLVAFLPDVGEVVLRLVPGPTGLALSLDARVRSASPLARALDAVPTGLPFGLARLPDDVALAWAFRRPPASTPPLAADTDGGLTAMLARVGGDRFTQKAHAAVARAEVSVEASGGSGTVVAFGARASGPWALLARAGTRAAPDPAAVRDALGADYASTLLGTFAGCPGKANPTVWKQSEGARATTLCRPTQAGGPTPRVALAQAPGSFALAFEQAAGDGTVGVTSEMAARLATGSHTSGGLGDGPDVERDLDALGHRVLLAGVVSPSRLLPAAGLFAFAPLRRAAQAAGVVHGATPIVFGAAHTERGLRLTIELSPGAIRDLTETVIPLLRP